MGTTNAFEETRFDFQVFFAEYWRKKPLLIRNGAEEFLGRTWHVKDFDAAYAETVSRGVSVNEREGQVTFIENVSAYDQDLATRADAFREVFGAPQTWFDAIRTYARSGIGAHFDHSDNFALQQEGTKDWSLAAPTNIDPSVRVRRMLNDPSVGSHALPEGERVNFVLNPGDLLYIPLMWLHEGVSHANSLSVSLVCPAVSLYSAVTPFLTRALKAHGLGGEAIEAPHSGMNDEEREHIAERIRQDTMALLNKATDDEVVRMVLNSQEKAIFA